VIVDVRSMSSQSQGRIPGAVWIDDRAFETSLRASGLEESDVDDDRLLRVSETSECCLVAKH